MRLAGLLCTGLLGVVTACLKAPELGDDQKPPTTGTADIELWLAKGYYTHWACQGSSHMGTGISAHIPYNRICSNKMIADNATDLRTPTWPVGAAAVKELRDEETDKEPVGYAVYLKTKDDSADGANWYWYERVSPKSDIPHNADGIVADSVGGGGSVAESLCVGCHKMAGSDPLHGSNSFSRDQVYTPIPPPP